MLYSNKDLKKLLIPLILEQALNVTIGMMDTVMVASCGEAAVSGCSLVDSITILLINLFAALATGGTVVVSQYLGKKESDNASRAAKQLIYVAMAVSLVIMLVCLILRHPLLRLIFGSIDAAVMQNAQTYFLIITLSFPFIAVYNSAAALLRSVNNSKVSLEVSAIMNVVNVCGNALLIYGARWGVAGAGVATLISRIVGAIIMMIVLLRSGALITRQQLFRFQWQGDMSRRILTVGIPTGLENSFFSLGKLLLLGMVSTFGTASIAANAVGNTMTSLQTLPGAAIGLGMITVVARCVGAKEYDQARFYVKKLMKLTYLLMGILNALILFFVGPIAGLFNLSQEASAMARVIIALHGAGCIVLWPLSFALPNALRAANDAKFTMKVSCFSMVAFRIAFGYLLAKVCGIGVLGVWMAMQIDWLFRIIMFVKRYKSHVWEKNKLL